MLSEVFLSLPIPIHNPQCSISTATHIQYNSAMPYNLQWRSFVLCILSQFISWKPDSTFAEIRISVFLIITSKIYGSHCISDSASFFFTIYRLYFRI